MNIRTIKNSDNSQLAELIREVFTEHNAPSKGTVYSDPTTDNLFELFCNKKSVLWVAEKNNKIIGCCGIFPTNGLPENYAELVKFYLSAQERGKGIGTLLILKAVESAKELGYHNLYLESLPEFSKAVKIYERLGFKKLEKPLGESGHTGCSIWMEKRLF